MPYETLVVTTEESFGLITLDRPPANAISEALMRELNAALSDFEADAAVRSVIITGAGDRIFCAGADLGSAFAEGDAESFVRFGTGVVRRIERFPKPVVAALNGHALGGGCEIAMACHFRLLREGARMGQTESNLGIIPGYGGTQRLPRLIGRTKALEFLILGTQIPAQECLALGLVNRLCKSGETLAEAKVLARQLARRPRGGYPPAHRGRRRGTGGAHREGPRHRGSRLHEVPAHGRRRGRDPGVLRQARAELPGPLGMDLGIRDRVVALAVAFLVLERARFITGAVLTVTGGMDRFTF